MPIGSHYLSSPSPIAINKKGSRLPIHIVNKQSTTGTSFFRPSDPLKKKSNLTASQYFPSPTQKLNPNLRKKFSIQTNEKVTSPIATIYKAQGANKTVPNEDKCDPNTVTFR
jgi:hypothetical protein